MIQVSGAAPRASRITQAATAQRAEKAWRIHRGRASRVSSPQRTPPRNDSTAVDQARRLVRAPP